MSTLDYQPVLNGAPYDPEPVGGAVTTLALYPVRDHSGSPVTVGPAVRIRAAVYRFTIPDATTAGRYWPRITWTPETAGSPLVDDLTQPLDLPVRDDLVVSPEALAVKLGVALPLTADQRALLTDALLDAQSDVEAYLGRAVLPQIVTERRTWPPGGWSLNAQPVIEVLTETEILDDGIATGWWEVTYTAGLDARSDEMLRPIRRLLLAHAAQQDDAIRMWATVGSGSTDTGGTAARRIKTVSAEGQSISYEFGRPGAGTDSSGGSSGLSEAVGGPVRWASIDRWRLRGRRVFQRGGGSGGLTSLSVRP